MESFLLGQTSPLSEALDWMRSLVITEEQRPNYAQPGLGAESGEFYVPATTHFITTVEDLTYMLDYDSKDIDGMDDDAGEEQAQNPPFTGRWTATSSYDVAHPLCFSDEVMEHEFPEGFKPMNIESYDGTTDPVA